MYSWGDFWSRPVSGPCRRKWGTSSVTFDSADFCFSRWWKHVGTSSHARMAARAEMKCATADLRWGTTKLHFCKLATLQEVARSFAAVQAERASTLCAGFVSTGGCSRGGRWFPWLPGADFSTTQPYLACCTGNQICLSGTLSPSPAFGTIH